MRIMILLNSRFPTPKAYGLQVQTTARGFAEAGIEAVVAFPRRTAETPAPIAGVSFLPYGPHLTLKFPFLFNLYQIIGLFGLRRLLENEKPDIVLANDPIQAGFLPKPWKAVWDLHDLPDPRRLTRRWLISKIVKRVSGILSTNNLKLEHLYALGLSLPSTIRLPNPVTFDPERYRSIERDGARQKVGFAENEQAIVYAGQLFDWKGVDTSILAARHLPPEFRIHIVGGLGDDLERCKKLAASLTSASATVVFHGMLPAEEIPTWLRAASVVVIPNSGRHRLSIEDTNPLKAYEALAAEAAIVASDLPAIRDALGETAAYFKPDDPESLALAIKNLCADLARLEKMRALASKAPLLTAKERAEKLRDFFSSILK